MPKYRVEVTVRQIYEVKAETEDRASETAHVLEHGKLVDEVIEDAILQEEI